MSEADALANRSRDRTSSCGRLGDDVKAKTGCEAGPLTATLAVTPPADVEAAPYFALLAELAARHGLPQLSMGMSEDFPTAIMLGATHIRVGTALFGARAAG